MNIALFTEMEKVDGQGRFMLMHARWLKAHGHHVVIFSPDSPMLAEMAGWDIPHVRMQSVLQGVPVKYEDLVGDVGRLMDACREHAIEVMVATAKLPAMMANAALGDRLPIYIPILSPIYFLVPSPENVALMQRAAREGRVLAYAPGSAKVQADTFGYDTMLARYSPLAIDDRTVTPTRPRDEVRRELGIGDNDLMLLTICRLAVDKAPAIPPLARAADAVSAKINRRITLVVVGDGPLEEQTRAQCPPSVKFLGARYDLPDLYHACDIYAGEGMTQLEAAMARRAVIMTCAAFHPKTPGVAFGLYGLHSLDFVYLDWSNHAPPTSFEDALTFLADDALRDRLAQAAYDTAKSRNHVDVAMPWLVDVLAGKPVPNAMFLEDAAVTIAVPGGTEDGIDAIGKLCYERGEELRLSVTFDQPVSWGRTLAMPQEHVQALSLAARRVVTPSTPRARFVENALTCDDDVPQNVRDAFADIADEVPPTSIEPPFALSPPRSPLHLIVASTEDAAERLVGALNAAPASAIIIWIPENFTNARAQALMQRVEQLTKAGLVIMGQSIPWTSVGRLFVAADTYCDDGSPQFEKYRRLAQQFSRNGAM